MMGTLSKGSKKGRKRENTFKTKKKKRKKRADKTLPPGEETAPGVRAGKIRSAP